MKGDDSCDGIPKHRSVLGDLTNRNGKRGFPLNPGRFVLENGYSKKGNGKGENDKFSGAICRKFETLGKGKENAGRVIVMNGNTDNGIDGIKSLLKAKRLCWSDNGDESIQDNVESEEIKEPSSSSNCNLCLMTDDARKHEIMEGEVSKNTCASAASVTVHCNKAIESVPSMLQEGQDDNVIVNTDSTRNAIGIDDVKKALARHVCGKNEIGKYVPRDGKFLASSGGSYECVDSQVNFVGGDVIPSQESMNKENLKAFDVNLQASSSDGGFITNDSLESDKACSCSFCLKAAYLWSDLHYQDTKGRLAALNKSKKQVRLLVGRNYNHDDNQKIMRENSSKSTKLEFDLMKQWKSLFLHTEDALARESIQLQSDISKLKELRENCEKDLEMAQMAHLYRP